MGRKALRALGLDVGEGRIGVSISDPTGLLSTPLTAITRSSLDSDLAAILDLAKEHSVREIVVGMPLSLNGQFGPQARITEHFLRALSKRASIPIRRWDERFSTQEAERRLREAGAKPSRDRGRLDAAAAAVILQGYLDSRRCER